MNRLSPYYNASINSGGNQSAPRRDTGRKVHKPHRIVAKVIADFPEGHRITSTETEDEVVLLHECTALVAHKIRFMAVKSGMRRRATLHEAFHWVLMKAIDRLGAED